MIRTQSIISMMWAMGMPSNDARWANIYRAAVKAGLNDAQAFELTKDAYNASNLYDWKLAEGSGIHRTTRETHAAIFPQGKCAEELNAAKEGRKSLWGSPEFHRGMTGL